MIIDDLSQTFPLATCGTRWQLVTDTVMGGVSQGTLLPEIVARRSALRMRGGVSLENNGGFVQMALDLCPNAKGMDVSGFDGIAIDVFGHDEAYDLRLRTDELTRSWQSYRQPFQARSSWHTVKLPFADFERHRTDLRLDLSQVKRIGLLAIGREFDADLAVSRVSFY